jgi:hypothetical protein
MKKMTHIASIAAATLALAVPVYGQFDRYVALGDSLSAGVEGGCLVERNQLNSFPSILARQMGLGDFQQPLMDELPAGDPNGLGPCLGAVFVPPSTITVGEISEMGLPLNATLSRPYNNLGVPGAHVGDLVDLKHGNPNGRTAEQFAIFVLRNFPGSPFDGLSAVDEANALGPDLVTLWAGNNDILPAVSTALFLPGVTVTPPDELSDKYAQILTQLGPGKTIVAGNVLDVTAIPFATTVSPILAITPGGPVKVLGPGNAAFACTPVPPDQGCPVPDGTLVTLPAATLLAQGIGVPVALGGTGLPLPVGTFSPPATLSPGVLLYPDLIDNVRTLVDNYNATIAAQISGAGGVLIDTFAIFAELNQHGFHVGGLTLSTNLLTGGIVSADGIHPSTIGYSIVASAFIQGMNEQLGLEIPQADLTAVLFTPNVPPTGSEARGAGPLGYSLGMWRRELDSTLAGKGLTVVLPEATPRASGGSRTRVVGPRD